MIDEHLRARIKEATDAAIQGRSVADYQQELESLLAVAADEGVQSFIDGCWESFRLANSVDFSEVTRAWTTEELMENLSATIFPKLFFSPIIKGDRVFPLVPGATAEVNHVILFLGLFVAYQDEYLDRIYEFAELQAFCGACKTELDRRFGALRRSTLDFCALVLFERGKEAPFRRLKQKLRPRNWQDIAHRLGHHREDEEEIDSRVTYKIGLMVGEQSKRTIQEVGRSALEGEFGFLRKKVHDELIDDVRFENAQMRRPQQGMTSLDRLLETDDDEAGFEPRDERPLPDAVVDLVPEHIEAGRAALMKAYGARAADVLLAIHGLSSGAVAAVAAELGLTDRQVRTYLRRMRENPEALFSALGGEV